MSNAPHQPFRQAVRWFYAWVAALIFAGAAPLIGLRLIEAGTLAGRVIGVILGAVSWLPMAVIVAAIIRAHDEFQRRIHLVALALSFASALLVLTLVDWLVRAEFIRQPPLQALWIAIAVLWLVWLLIVKWRFERES